MDLISYLRDLYNQSQSQAEKNHLLDFAWSQGIGQEQTPQNPGYNPTLWSMMQQQRGQPTNYKGFGYQPPPEVKRDFRLEGAQTGANRDLQRAQQGSDYAAASENLWGQEADYWGRKREAREAVPEYNPSNVHRNLSAFERSPWNMML